MNRQAMIVVGSLLGGLLLLLGLGWQFVLSPVSKDTAAKRVTLKEKQDELTKVKGAQAQYEKFKREAEATRRDVQLLRQRLDPDFSTGEAMRVINGQIQSLNLKDPNLTIKQRENSKLVGQSNLDEVFIRLNFKSDYETLGKLINGLVSQLRLISPERVTLSAFEDRSEGRVTLDAILELKIFLETRVAGK